MTNEDQAAQEGAQVTVPARAQVGAAVSAAPAPVTLYHPDGREIAVPAAQAPLWLASGFSTVKHDVAALLADLDHLFPSALVAVTGWVAEVAATGTVTHDAQAAGYVAQQAVEDLVATYGHLYDALHARATVHQPTPGVPMGAPDIDAATGQPSGTYHPEVVDASQVALYQGQGYIDPAQEGSSDA